VWLIAGRAWSAWGRRRGGAVAAAGRALGLETEELPTP